MRSQTSFQMPVTAVEAWTALRDRIMPKDIRDARTSAADTDADQSDISTYIGEVHRHLKDDFEILYYDVPSRIGWRAKAGPFIGFDEIYVVNSIFKGVRVDHSFECRGLIGRLIGLMLAGHLMTVMRQDDEELSCSLGQKYCPVTR